MHVEFLSHWSSNLGREMYVNRYGHAGLPIIVFASSGGSHNEYADFGMIEACEVLLRPVRSSFSLLAVLIVRAGWRTGSILTIEQKCIVHMSVMSSRKLFLSLSIRQAGLTL